LVNFAAELHIEYHPVEIQPDSEDVDEDELPPLVDASTEWEEVDESVMPPLEAIHHRY
jgi:hypothetical protein